MSRGPEKDLASAEAAFAQATTVMLKPLESLKFGPFFASDKLDGVPAKFVVLHPCHAPRHGCIRRAEKRARSPFVGKLVSDESLMKDKG